MFPRMTAPWYLCPLPSSYHWCCSWYLPLLDAAAASSAFAVPLVVHSQEGVQATVRDRFQIVYLANVHEGNEAVVNAAVGNAAVDAQTKAAVKTAVKTALQSFRGVLSDVDG
jgi:hypothetical protein